jgi:hypothetical protein
MFERHSSVKLTSVAVQNVFSWTARLSVSTNMTQNWLTLKEKSSVSQILDVKGCWFYSLNARLIFKGDFWNATPCYSVEPIPTKQLPEIAAHNTEGGKMVATSTNMLHKLFLLRHQIALPLRNTNLFRQLRINFTVSEEDLSERSSIDDPASPPGNQQRHAERPLLPKWQLLPSLVNHFSMRTTKADRLFRYLRKIEKTTVSFVMSVSPSAWNNSGPH